MKIPKLRFHKATKRYMVRIEGKDIYLGYDQVEAQKKYHLLLAEIAAGRPAEIVPQREMYICELIDRYVTDRDDYYRKNPNAFARGRAVLRILNRQYGKYRPDQFGMTELRHVRELLMEPNANGHRHCRNEINRAMRELNRLWQWCVSMELLPAELYHKYITLETLKRGHCDAPETNPVSVVPLDHVRAVQARVSSSVASMIELQLLTGARPGEVVNLKAEDIDRSGQVWRVVLTEHKTAYRGKSRTLFFGPKAQTVLRPFLLRRGPGEHLFQPMDTFKERSERAETHRRDFQPEYRITDRTVGDCYDVAAYRKAIARGCVAAKVPHWHPHQLRHTAATEMRKAYGIEVARAVLGHATIDASEIYAEVDSQVAERVASEIG